MKILSVDTNINFKEIVDNIEIMRDDYHKMIASFSVFERKKALQLMRQFKTKIYSLHFEEYKKDLAWRYMNDEIEYEELLILGGLKNGCNNKRNV